MSGCSQDCKPYFISIEQPKINKENIILFNKIKEKREREEGGGEKKNDKGAFFRIFCYTIQYSYGKRE